MNIDIELFKNIAAVIGCITAVLGFCNLVSKTFRNFLRKFIRKFAGADRYESKLDAILEQTKNIPVLEVGLQAALRHEMRGIYYRYISDGEMSIKDKEAFIDLHTQYKELGGNHQADVWYEEMKQAKVFE